MTSPKVSDRSTQRLRTMCAAAFLLALVVPGVAFARCEKPGKDKDQDGLNNCTETFITATDKKNADSDHDGLSDGLEVRSGMNPLLADSDNDTIDDGDEVVDGTDPESSDSDDDGIDDSSDEDPNDDLVEHLGGAVTGVNTAGSSISVLGLTIDASGATFEDDAALSDVLVGMHVEIELDAAALASGSYKATKIEVDDNSEIDDGADTGDGDGDGESDDDDVQEEN